MTFAGKLRWWCVGLLIGGLAAGGIAAAQTGAAKTKAKPKPATGAGGSVKALDARALEMQENLLREAGEIARGYEDAGDYDRAKWLLEVLQKLDPKNAALKSKIDELTDKSLNSSEFDYELDVSKGWSPAVALVHKDRPARIEATGQYKLELAGTVGPDGLPTDPTGADLVPGAPLGALIGVIVDADTKKAGRPFEIKSKKEWPPRDNGYLQLKVNLPNGHKSTGKVKIKLSGMERVRT